MSYKYSNITTAQEIANALSNAGIFPYEVKLSHSPVYPYKLRATWIDSMLQSNRIDFGNRKYEDYLILFGGEDAKERRENYLARATEIKNKEGRPTHLIFGTRNCFSVFVLWDLMGLLK